MNPGRRTKACEQRQRRYLEDFFTNYFEDGAGKFEALIEKPSGAQSGLYGTSTPFGRPDHNGVRYIISERRLAALSSSSKAPKKRFAHTLWVEVRDG